MIEGREEDIRPCILCHNGCFNMCHYKGVPNDQELSDSLHLSRCAVNAETMQWNKHYIKKTKSPKTVHIIGGGLTGCEIAYEIALQGKSPIIVEMKDDLISQKGVCLSNSSYLREWFALHEVPVYLETSLKEVRDGSVVCTDKTGKDIELKCDSVISCAGYIPNPVAKEGKNLHLVGDCKEVGNLRSVIWRAWDVAMKI